MNKQTDILLDIIMSSLGLLTPDAAVNILDTLHSIERDIKNLISSQVEPHITSRTTNSARTNWV